MPRSLKYFSLFLLVLTIKLYAQDSVPPKPDPDAVPRKIPIVSPEITIPPQGSKLISVSPLSTLPPIQIDSNDLYGIAQKLAKVSTLQGRLLWVDGTANIDRINSESKIVDLCKKIKYAGFNIIVFDVKPLIGFTLYPSAIEPKLSEWRGKTIDPNFDPTAIMVREAHANGLLIVGSMNVFSEGHSIYQKGPGYAQPEHQTVVYETNLFAESKTDPAKKYQLFETGNALDPSKAKIGVFTDASKLDRAIFGSYVLVVNSDGKIIAALDGSSLSQLAISLPNDGSALVAQGDLAAKIKSELQIGDVLSFSTSPYFIPISQQMHPQVPLMMNPHDPYVQSHTLDLINEVMTKYPIDGVIFDDRLRFANINADFSDLTRKQFESYVGHTVVWPDDIISYKLTPGFYKKIQHGKEYDNWLLFRSLTTRNWVAKAAALVKSIRPEASCSVYAGSWYGQYPTLGANWGANDFEAGFPFLTDSYRKTGFADQLDFIVTGCYYNTATINDAFNLGKNPGGTVEAAGTLTNRAVNDQTWSYAGLILESFRNDHEGLKRCIQAALAATQGVMVFDLSHHMDEFWELFHDAFITPLDPPHKNTALTQTLRREHELSKKSGINPPPLIIYNGVSGTGL